MATSGSYDFRLNRNEVVSKALMLINVVALGETPTDDEMTEGAKTLNMMVKGWQADNLGLWLNQKVTLLLEYGEYSYTLGPTGDHCSASVIKTEIKVAASSGDSTIDVDSISGMSSGDNIGIELDDGTLQWTTINGAPSGDTVTLTASLTDDASVDDHVYVYTSKIQRPLEIIEARRVDSDDNETQLPVVSMDEYMSLSDKDSTGAPNQVAYDPTLTNGTLYVWMACDDVKDRINMTIKRPLQDFDSATDDYDFPQEWAEAIVYNLAIRLGIEYGRPVSIELAGIAESALENAKGFDQEQTSIFFQPGRR